MKKAMFWMLLVMIFLGLAGPSQAQIDRLETKVFAVNTIVIPMDEKQGDRLSVFGFMQWLNRQSKTYFRLIQGPLDNVVLVTGACPTDGCAYKGGPLFIEGVLPSPIPTEFSGVTVDVLKKTFASTSFARSSKAPKIVLVSNPPVDMGHTYQVLNAMKLKYDSKSIADIEANPNILANYDLIIDDCPGWSANYVTTMPTAVQEAIKGFVNAGGEAIFTDIALIDLYALFGEYAGIAWNGLVSPDLYNFTVNPYAETPGQYAGPPSLDLHIPPLGIIGVSLQPDPPKWTEVRPLLDSIAFTPIDWMPAPHLAGYAMPAFYFPYGKGVVEGFGFHIPDQVGETATITAQLLGNKVTHPVPNDETSLPGCGRMTGGGDSKVCTTTTSTKSTKSGINCSTGTGGKTTCYRISFGFTLHCDPTELPNQLNITWEKGEHFKLDTLTSANCYDDPDFNPKSPKAGWDSYEGVGTGTYKGQPGYTIWFKLQDGGEPGRRDVIDFYIFPTDSGEPIVNYQDLHLDNGNVQAHRWDCPIPIEG